MINLDLRQVADGISAARHLGAPIAYRAEQPCDAYVREGEAWLSYPASDGQSWLITASAGSALHRPDDLEGAALIAATMLQIGCTDPFGPPALPWHLGGSTAAAVAGADRSVYAAAAGDAVVLTAIPAGTRPTPGVDWLAPSPDC